jgi:hypothetical protein
MGHTATGDLVHNCPHKELPLLHILSHLNPTHITPYTFKVILILYSHLRLGVPIFFPSGFPIKTL